MSVKGKKWSMVSTSFSNRHPPLYAPLSDLSVCNAFQSVSFTQYKQVRWPRWPTWLQQLRSFLKRWGASFCHDAWWSQLTFTLPGPRLLPLVHQGASAASLGKTHPTHGATISHLCLFTRLALQTRGWLPQGWLRPPPYYRAWKVQAGTPEMQSPAQRLFSHDPPQQAVSWPQRGVISDNQNEQ